MSRAATGDVVRVKPSNNVYTAIVVAAVVIEIVGLVLIVMRSQTLGVDLFKF
jgi:hypothetical protein